MNKKFLQSVAAGIATLSLVASCSHFGSKESNTCGAKNGCAAAAKKDEAHKCSSKAKEANSSVKKEEAKKEETKAVKKEGKKHKKHKKAEAAKTEAAKAETKTEEKKN